MDLEKHRTLLFADNLELSRQSLGRCRVATVDTVLGPAGTGFVLPGEEPEGDDENGWRLAPAPGRFAGFRVWNGEAGVSRSIEAAIFPNLGQTHTMVTWKGQNFGAFASEWETQHSPLVNPSVRPEPTPVVDACGVVVGYYLKKISTKNLFTNDAGEIFYLRLMTGSANYDGQAESIVGRDLYITAAEAVDRFAADSGSSTTSHTQVSVAPGDGAVRSTHVVGGYKYRIQAEKWADVLLDIDGFVQVLDTYGDAKSKSWAQKYNEGADSIPLLGWLLPRVPIPPSEKCMSDDWRDDPQMDEMCSAEMAAFWSDSMMLMVDLLTLGDSKAVRGLLDVTKRTAMRGARTTLLALTLDIRVPNLARPVRAASRATIARLALPDGRLVEAAGLRVVRGYDAIMGVPRDHFAKMVEAAREANGIAVFRANKPAAIPLIERGAHPKPKYYNAFKSSKETGVLTAKESAHIQTAYEHGDFVVDDDLVPRRAVLRDGKKVTEELKLQNPYWKLEKGQVIKPDGVPIVGDYDLLGFLPNESPGRNIASVPKDHVPDSVKGDWAGPDVERYQKALNSKFDKPGPRVLHGAQDQFQHSQYGGFTDDTAYAVYGDGSAVIMQGRQGQEAFYQAYGRQTATGAYPKPPPGTPIVDELAARRAAKQAGH